MSSGQVDWREVEELIRAYALLNAVEHGGRAQVGPVMSKVVGVRPELRPVAREVAKLAKRIVEEVNRLSLEEQRRLLEEKYSWVLERRQERRGREGLPPLPEAERGRVVTRFAPNPDYAIHLGNARPALLSYEYARMYGGKLILRFEDTDPRVKRPLPEAYDAIREDLRWLGVKWDEEYIQSLRLPIYYELARRLIELGGAYVDTEPPEVFRRYRDEGRLEDYPPRRRSVEENLELWERMLSGEFPEGGAVLRIKTDPRHPDPSVRDWVAFRIVDTRRSPHPLVGDEFLVWPTYNFAAAVDDHLMGVTHILRAREHRQNTVKQQFLYKYFGWKYPIVIHFGRLKLEGLVMSKSSMRELAAEEGVARFDDPRFATIAGLRRRGFQAEALRKVIIEVGVKETDASISLKNLAAVNRSIVDSKARRFMAVLDPVRVEVRAPWSGVREFEIPYHPSGKLGSRRIPVRSGGEMYLERSDAEAALRSGKPVRLMGAFNARIVRESGRLVAVYVSDSAEEAKRSGYPIIQWVPVDYSAKLELVEPSGLDLIHRLGWAERSILDAKVDEVVQLVRIGFARVDAVRRREDPKATLIFAHN